MPQKQLPEVASTVSGSQPTCFGPNVDCTYAGEVRYSCEWKNPVDRELVFHLFFPSRKGCVTAKHCRLADSAAATVGVTAANSEGPHFYNRAVITSRPRTVNDFCSALMHSSIFLMRYYSLALGTWHFLRMTSLQARLISDAPPQPLMPTEPSTCHAAPPAPAGSPPMISLVSPT